MLKLLGGLVVFLKFLQRISIEWPRRHQKRQFSPDDCEVRENYTCSKCSRGQNAVWVNFGCALADAEFLIERFDSTNAGFATNL